MGSLTVARTETGRIWGEAFGLNGSSRRGDGQRGGSPSGDMGKDCFRKEATALYQIPEMKVRGREGHACERTKKEKSGDCKDREVSLLPAPGVKS